MRLGCGLRSTGGAFKNLWTINMLRINSAAGWNTGFTRECSRKHKPKRRKSVVHFLATSSAFQKPAHTELELCFFKRL